MRNIPDSGCRFCGRLFKRQDNLDRHELSHQDAQFRCEFPSCGMTFHRQDVLKRHRKVHQSGSVTRHRQPRRGATPKSIVASGSSSSHVSRNDPSVDSAYVVRNALVSPFSITSGLSQLSPFEFCLLHFEQACATRWPFLHRTSIHHRNILPEMKLAMASLGGYSVPEYYQDALKFFLEAQRLLSNRQKQTHNTLNAEGTSPLSPVSDPSVLLAVFQTQVILLECALWHTGANAKEWAFKTTLELASTTVPELTKRLAKVAAEAAQQSWKHWLYEEQAIRALWTFYCLTQKAMQQFPFAISTFRTQRDLRLPQSEAAFDATDEEAWLRSKRDLLTSSSTSSNMNLKSALQLLQSTAASRQPHPDLANLGPMARHIVLVCLLEMYTGPAQVMLLKSEGSSSDHHYRDTHFNNPTTCGQVLQTAKSLWYISPGHLLSSSASRGVDLQNTLLLSHLETIFLKNHVGDPNCSSKEQASLNLCAMASTGADILIATYENDMLEIATKVSWLLDAACKRYVVGFTQKMIKWTEYLEQQNGTSSSCIEDSHSLLYHRMIPFLHKADRESGKYERDLRDMRQFKEAVADAWCAVLHCPYERWCTRQD